VPQSNSEPEETVGADATQGQPRGKIVDDCELPPRDRSLRVALTFCHQQCEPQRDDLALIITADNASTATPASPLDTYGFTASGAADANYDISYVGGTFTVTQPLMTGIVSDPLTTANWLDGADGSETPDTDSNNWTFRGVEHLAQLF
jgi:hypothetical protein